MAEQPTGPASIAGWSEMLVPVRGGPDALARVRLALRLASATGASVTALYVMDERLLGDPTSSFVREDLFDQLAKEGKAVFDAIRGLSDARDVRLATRLERGPVVETVARVAQEIGVDVIVVGSHRQTWLGRLLGGSVAESMMRVVDCAVLAVPPADTNKQR